MPSADFWFHSPRPLMELADALERAVGTAPFQYDQEDVWEWAAAEVVGAGLELDLSRRHREGSYAAEDPVRITLTARDPALARDAIAKAWGPALATALAVRVRFGTIVQRRNDELDYREESMFAPE